MGGVHLSAGQAGNAAGLRGRDLAMMKSMIATFSALKPIPLIKAQR